MPIAECGAVPLTTVSHPIEKSAEQVVAMLYSRLEGSYRGPSRCDLVRGELVQRQSCMPPH